MTRYFAYGSNLSRFQMAARCPGAIAGGPATLQGWRWLIMKRGYATIAPEPGAKVYGCLWDLSEEDERILDRYEGVAQGVYRKQKITVETPKGPQPAMAYVATDASPGKPARGYFDIIMDGANDQKLPAAYVTELQRWQYGIPLIRLAAPPARKKSPRKSGKKK